MACDVLRSGRLLTKVRQANSASVSCSHVYRTVRTPPHTHTQRPLSTDLHVGKRLPTRVLPRRAYEQYYAYLKAKTFSLVVCCLRAVPAVLNP